MIDWDDAFDNSGHVPGSGKLPQKWAREAEVFRKDMARAGRVEPDLVYGSRPRNRIDLFRPEGPARGVVVFVHGGYWHKLDKSFWSHLAAGPLAHGWAVAVPGYTLAPQARIADITGEVGRAVTFAAERVGGPLRLTGHSAGGHLVARMICDDSPLRAEIVERVEKVVPISGIHDLRPLVQTRMNKVLRLTPDEAASESPALHRRRGAAAVTFWVGAAERPEFLRQNRLAAECWAGEGVRDIYEPGQHHFSVVAGLARADSSLVTELLN